MKKYILILAAVICAAFSAAAEEYDIESLLFTQRIKEGTVGVDRYGDPVQISSLLVPVEINSGNYQIQVTRVDANFYKVDGTDYYIKTKFCYEYCTREDAVLVVKSKYSYYNYSLVFLDNQQHHARYDDLPRYPDFK